MSKSSAADAPTYRLEYLDSLRGVAAVLVVLHHAYQSAPLWSALVRYSPARILLNGRSSVIFFFVLSGFVLAYGLWRGDQSARFGTFLMRRLARIYLPYLAAGTIAIAAMLVLHPAALADAAVTFNEMWSSPLTSSSAFAHLALLGTKAAKGINTPSWSLVYELRISLFIPLLCFVALRAPWLLAVGTLAVYVLCAAAGHILGLDLVPYTAEGLLPNLVVTLHFTAAFVIGILLAKAAVARSPWLVDMSSMRKVALGVAAMVLLMVFRDETAAVGSAFVIILALNAPGLQRVLRYRPLIGLGRVSFSLYLTHMIVMQLVVRALHGAVPLHAAILVALVAVVPVTALFFRWIERPAARWARQIGRPGTRSLLDRSGIVGVGTAVDAMPST